MDCKNCTHWKRGADCATGNCRAHPPAGGTFPHTRSDDSCGEFQPAATATEGEDGVEAISEVMP